MSNLGFIIGFIFTVGWSYGFLKKQEFKTNTNLRIIIHWIMALIFFLYHDVAGIHLFYTFPLGIVLSFLGIPIANKVKPNTIIGIFLSKASTNNFVFSTSKLTVSLSSFTSA